MGGQQGLRFRFVSPTTGDNSPLFSKRFCSNLKCVRQEGNRTSVHVTVNEYSVLGGTGRFEGKVG